MKQTYVMWAKCGRYSLATMTILAALLAGCPDDAGDDDTGAGDDDATADDDDDADDDDATAGDDDSSAGDDDDTGPGPEEYFSLDSCYYGDAHVHTAFSKDAFMAHTFLYVGPLSKYGDVVRDPWYAYDYAMDVTELDWVAINDHAEAQPNSHLLYPTGWGDFGPLELPDTWNLYLEQTRLYPRSCDVTGGAEPCLLIFPGFEFTGESYGHKNVLWKNLDYVPDTNYPAWIQEDGWDWEALLEGGVDAWLGGVEDDNTPEDLWAWCVDQADQLATDNPGMEDQIDFLTMIHTPAEAPIHQTDWGHLNVDYMPLVEVFSKHGNSLGLQEVYEFVPDQDPTLTYLTKLQEWTTTGDPNLELGAIGATDTHTAKPGNDTIDPENVEYVAQQMDYGGGVGAVVSLSKERDDIWEAFQAKRTFATTGPKIRVIFRARTADRIAWMGETVDPDGSLDWDLVVSARTDPAPVSDAVSALSRIEIWQDGEAGIPMCTLDVGGMEEAEGSCLLSLDPAQRTSVMATVILENSERAWTSPIFFE